MTRDEMLAGLRLLSEAFPVPHCDAIHAAITALEAAPAQAEAPPSESARERVWDLCESLGLEGDESALALVQEWIERRQAGVDRLRAELEQARDEVERLYVAASERDTAREQKRAIRERLREVEQERDAALEKAQRLDSAIACISERDELIERIRWYESRWHRDSELLCISEAIEHAEKADKERDAALAKVALAKEVVDAQDWCDREAEEVERTGRSWSSAPKVRLINAMAKLRAALAELDKEQGR